MLGHGRGLAEMTAAMTISGTIGWFVLASGRPALDVVFWRCIFAAGALAVYCLMTGALRCTLTRKQLAIAVLGGVAIVLNWLLLFASYSFASVSISTAVYNVQPFILLGFGVFLFGERLSPAKIGWLALAFAGVVLILMEKPTADYVGGSFGWGVLLALTASLGWAIAAATTKFLIGVPPQLIALIHVLTGIVILAPFARFSDLPSDGSTWTFLVTLGVVHTGIMYALMYSGVQRLPTHLQGTLTFINPVVAVLVDVFLLDHALHPIQLAGIATILLAAAGMILLPLLLARRHRREAPIS